jgi:hypothetical protein
MPRRAWKDFGDVETRASMDDEAGRRYEQACVQAVQQHLTTQLSQMRALGRTLLAVELMGSRPHTRLVVRYRDHVGKVRRFGFSLWDENRLGPESALVAHPNDLASILVTNLAEPGPDP